MYTALSKSRDLAGSTVAVAAATDAQIGEVPNIGRGLRDQAMSHPRH